MATETPASDDRVNPDALRLRRRRRRRTSAFLAVLIALLVWPNLLDSELGKRLDSLRVLGPVAGHGAGGGAGAASKGRPAGVRLGPQIAYLGGIPNFGALREGMANPLTAQASPLEAAPEILALPDGDLLAGLSPITPVATPADSGPPPSFPVVTTPNIDPDPIIFVPGTPGTPGGGNPPVIGPPVVTPPVTPPPVVSPPDTPPVTPVEPPPIVSPPNNPPIQPPTDPGQPPPVIVNPGPGTSCADEPCGGGPGGGGGGGGPPPVSAAPEPAAWLEMILGATLLGVAMRRRRSQPATALRARSKA